MESVIALTTADIIYGKGGEWFRKEKKNDKKFQKHFKNCLSSKVIWGQKKREKSFQTVVLVEFYSLLLRFLFSFFFYKPNLDFISFLFSEKFGLFCSFLFAIRFYVDSFTVCLLPFHFAEHSYAWFLFFFFLFRRRLQPAKTNNRLSLQRESGGNKKEENNFSVDVLTMLWNEFKMRKIYILCSIGSILCFFSLFSTMDAVATIFFC